MDVLGLHVIQCMCNTPSLPFWPVMLVNYLNVGGSQHGLQDLLKDSHHKCEVVMSREGN